MDSGANMNSYKILIRGKVQHVYYRKFISQSLMQASVQGYVKNLSDGTVEIVARIYDDEYDDILKIIKKGSPMSRVEDIDIEILDDDDLVFDGFEIRT